MLYKNKKMLLWLIGPALAILLVFLYYPFASNIVNSLFDIKGLSGNRDRFIGLFNYKRMFTDTQILTALKNTAIIMVLTVVFQVGIGLVLAILVDTVKWGQKFFKTVYFFPIVISATAIGLMFNLFYAYYGGMFNQILTQLGSDPVNWKSDQMALGMISIPIIWSYVGFYFVLMLTGINDISTEIFESASLDGATGFKKVFYITLPLLRSVICTCTILAITGSLKAFDLPWVIAPKGAPKGLTHFAGTYMYQVTFIEENVDYGAAIALLIVIIGIVVSKLANHFLRDRSEMRR
ncbi:MAG: sugar ABC transporter permease [Oscillospiraceae bacterium]